MAAQSGQPCCFSIPAHLSRGSQSSIRPLVNICRLRRGRFCWLAKRSSTAYNILRHNGVPLGKADYVQHMFAYLRQ
jgi:Domain of unknown function (DUF1993)